MTASVEQALQPLDALRRALIRTLLRVPTLRRVLVQREVRVPVLLSLHAACAFVIVLLCPSFSLLLGPIVFGVPHLAADVRYLVLRRELPRWWRRAIAGFAGAFIALCVLQERHLVALDSTQAEHMLGSCQLLLGVAAGAAVRPRSLRAWFAILGALALAVCALTMPAGFRFSLVHVHNLVALGIWLMWFRRGLLWACLPVALALIGAGWLASGALLDVTVHHGILKLFGLHLFAAADWIAPGWPGTLGVSLTLAFAFLQSVHYAVWLVGIPQDDARAEGAPNFRMRYRALLRDFGGPGLAVVLGASALLVMRAVASVLDSYRVYMSLASFHAWLELSMLAYFLAGSTFRRRGELR